MSIFNTISLPKRIVCLTEESVEFLYAIGREDLIVGVSTYVERPPEAKKKPTISAFTHANLKKIKNLNPDLVIGYSDIQKDIARDLIGEGIEVWISNHRSLQGVLNYLFKLGCLVGEESKSRVYLSLLENKWEKGICAARALERKPRVYLEEWPEPMISGIRYFSELVEAAGGVDIFADLRYGRLAKERFVSSEWVVEKNPDIILGCWCGKPVDIASILQRKDWKKIKAVQEKAVFELPPAVFLQPGPALFEEGLEILQELFYRWKNT